MPQACKKATTQECSIWLQHILTLGKQAFSVCFFKRGGLTVWALDLSHGLGSPGSYGRLRCILNMCRRIRARNDVDSKVLATSRTHNDTAI